MTVTQRALIAFAALATLVGGYNWVQNDKCAEDYRKLAASYHALMVSAEQRQDRLTSDSHQAQTTRMVEHVSTCQQQAGFWRDVTLFTAPCLLLAWLLGTWVVTGKIPKFKARS